MTRLLFFYSFICILNTLSFSTAVQWSVDSSNKDSFVPIEVEFSPTDDLYDAGRTFTISVPAVLALRDGRRQIMKYDLYFDSMHNLGLEQEFLDIQALLRSDEQYDVVIANGPADAREIACTFRRKTGAYAGNFFFGDSQMGDGEAITFPKSATMLNCHAVFPLFGSTSWRDVSGD